MHPMLHSHVVKVLECNYTKNNARTLLSRILSIINPDWLQRSAWMTIIKVMKWDTCSLHKVPLLMCCITIVCPKSGSIKTQVCFYQSLRASSLQFTSPLEFNAIFRDGFPLRLDRNGWSKIRDPVTAKLKHLTVIVTCTLLRCDDVTYVTALWNFQKADLKPYPYGKKYTTFSFPIHGTLASNICLRDAPTCSCIQLYT